MTSSMESFHVVRRCRTPRCFALFFLLSLPASAAFAQTCAEVPDPDAHCDDVSFYTSGQSMWGPGDAAPEDATIKLFRQTWNGSKQYSAFQDFRTFGSFGGEVHAGSSGALGAYFGIGEFAGGTVDVGYDARMIFNPPPANHFRPGEFVVIRFAGTPQSTSLMETSGRLAAGKFTMWGELALDLTAGGKACAGTCTNMDLPPIKGKTLNPPSLPTPPGLPPPSADPKQLIFQVPAAGRDFAFGPLYDYVLSDEFKDKTLIDLQGDCDDGQIEIAEGGTIYEKAGISGCVGPPTFPESGPLLGTSPTLRAFDKLPFIDLDLDLDFWANKAKVFPPLRYEKEFLDGLVETYVDAIDFDLNGTLSVEQRLDFTPRPRATLHLPVPIAYLIFNSHSHALVATGIGATIDLYWGEELMFRAPDQEFDIQTEYALPNTFSNDTNLVFDFAFVERYLEAGFSLGSKLLGYEGFKICEPWPEYSCYRPGIWSPSKEFTVGPLWEFRQDLKTFRDSSLLDNNRPPWQLAGFLPAEGTPIHFDPAFLPTLVVHGIPTAPVPEGAPIAIDTFGSFDRDGTGFSAALQLYSSGKSISVPNPFNEDGQVQFGFSLPDDGWYVGYVLGYDLQPTPNDPLGPRSTWGFTIDVINVAPTVTGVDDGNGTEGVVYSLPVTVSDPGVNDTQVVSANWGDGTAPDIRSLPAGGGTAPFSHVYADNGDYPVTVCATDKDGGQTCESATLAIANAAPAVTSVGSEETQAPVSGGVGIELQFVAGFHDPGTRDSHTGRLVWDDATEVPLAVRESPFGPPGATTGMDGEASAADARVFGTAGTRTTQVCVRDDDDDEHCTAGPSIHIAGADLALTGSAAPATAPIGGILTLNYTAGNNGPEAAGNAFVGVDLPQDGGGNPTVTLLSAKQGGAGGLEQQLLASDLNAQPASLLFGTAVAVAGNTLAVSAEGRNSGRGGVYVFQRVGGSWQAGPIIVASDGAVDDGFGSSLAISDDESTIVVGAPGADLDGAGSGEGAVYVYRRIDGGNPASQLDDSWREEARRLVPAGIATHARFGNRVAIEGDTLVGAAFGDDVDDGGNLLNAAGSAWLYRRNNNGSPADPADDFWQPAQRLTAVAPLAEELFGIRVAMSAGRIAVASGEGDQHPGRITLFEASGGAWAATQEIDGAGLSGYASGFGTGGFALDGDRLLVSSPLFAPAVGFVHGFHFDGSAFVPDSEVQLNLTAGVALDGDYAAVGSYEVLPDGSGGTSSIGVVRTLQWNGSEWVSEGVLFPSSPADRGEQYGRDRVALVGRSVVAGNNLATRAGKSGMGAVFVMQTCEERPAGHVVCGLGTLPNGAGRPVEITVRVGCGLDAGATLTTDAGVGATVIDPVAGNNTTTLARTAADVVGLCDYDDTPPLVEPVVTGTPGSDGWYLSDVHVEWRVWDPDSGIDSTDGCDPQDVLDDTPGTTFVCAATNGQFQETRQQVTIRRAAGLPTIDADVTGTPGDHGWFTSGVTVDFVCDGGIAGIRDCSGPVVLPAEGRHPGITGTVTDQAGNTDTTRVDIDIDTTPPTIVATRTPANAAGWNNGDVTVEFQCSDALSGIAACSPPAVLTDEGAGQSAAGTAEDSAGLTATATVSDIHIDLTPPTVTQTVTPASNGAGWNREPVTVTFECSDHLWGVAEPF